MDQSRRRRPSFALLLLLHELYRIATNYGIPPVTLATIGTQIALYLRIIKLPWNSVWDVCISTDAILRKKEYLRLLISQIEHADDWHLYYNMVSFVWKGRTLERTMGSLKFILLLIVFTFSTAFTYVGINQILANVTDDNSYLKHCSVGFSGVIFALKVLTTHYNDHSRSYFMGIPIPVMSKYAVWSELILIQLISPNASFVGHLSGICVGFAYIYGPLKPLINFINRIIGSLLNSNHNANANDGHRLGTQNNYDSRNSRQNAESRPYSTRSRSAFYQNYVPSGMSEDEQLRRATEESLRNSPRDSYVHSQPNHPSAPPFQFDNSHSQRFANFPMPNPNPPYPTDNSPAFAPPYPTQSAFPNAEELRRLRMKKYESSH